VTNSPPTASPASQKIDPIGERYFRPLEQAETANDFLFYISAAASLSTPLIERREYPVIYDWAQGVFIVSVIAYAIAGLVVRLYFSPRAQERRLHDFSAHAFGSPESPERTTNYYTTSSGKPAHRIAAQLLENAFYSKDTALRMAWWERGKLVVYAILFVSVMLARPSDLATVVIVAQIVFSEQLLSRYARLEWFRRQCERTYEDLLRLFENQARLDVVAIEFFARYEVAKANAAITLSSAVFNKRKSANDQEWRKIAEQLKL
jgi:hypothetical protein